MPGTTTLFGRRHGDCVRAGRRDRCAQQADHGRRARSGRAARTRCQQVRKYRTFYSALREMTGWLVEPRVSHVAMESTGIYWTPVLHALVEADGLEVLLCNASHVKNVPGRKTDAADAVWLAELCEVGLLRGSFIPARDRRDPGGDPLPQEPCRG